MKKKDFLDNSLRVAINKWLNNIKRFQVEAGTFQILARCANNYIYPHLGDKLLSDITSKDIQSLANYLYEDRELGQASVHKCRYLLNNFLDFCVDLGIMENSPMAKSIEWKRVSSKEAADTKKVPGREQISEILEAANKSRFWKAFCNLAVSCDVRINEILPLQWKDIDTVNKSININKRVMLPVGHPYVQLAGDVAQSKGERQSKVSEETIQYLLDYKAYRNREQKRGGNKFSYIDDNDLVFGNDKGKLRSYSGLSHNFRKYLLRHELDNYNRFALRSFRHFYICSKAKEISDKQNELLGKSKSDSKREIEM